MNQNPNGQINPNGQNMPNANFQQNMGQPAKPGQPVMGAQQPRVNNASQFISSKPATPVNHKKKKNVMSKELITILGVLAIVAILYFTYNYQLNKNLDIKTGIPVAARKIKAGARITEEDIKRIQVPESTLNEIEAVTDSKDIVGKYVNYDTIIPEKSFFFTEMLSDTDTSPNSIFKDLLESETAIMIDVNLETTYGNTIMPGDKVDIYADAIAPTKNGKSEYIIGPLVTGATVLAVLDSAGNNVFADHENKLTPAYFIFTLDSKIIDLIRNAQKLRASEYNMDIYPVVNGMTYKNQDVSAAINQGPIVDLINSATANMNTNR